jgi:hypothetical protein
VWKKLTDRQIIALTGFGTFFFGFGAGAAYNWYLIQIHDPLVEQFRASLSYKSAIFGDGILLPAVNMVMVSFLLKHQKLLTRKVRGFGVFGGALITAYFHITQALEGIVNWAMPTPWHWNLLGLWHACYMFTVSSLISTFLATSIIVIYRTKKVPWQFIFAAFGVFLFLIILRLDYIDIKIW